MKWSKLTPAKQGVTKRPPMPKHIKKASDRCMNPKLKSPKYWNWVSYTVDCEMTDLEMREYEIFVGGFVLYYDDILRSAKVDHTLFFKWTKAKGKTIVDISLLPAPITNQQIKNPKYPKTVGLFDPAKHLLPDYDLTSDPPPPPPPPPPPIW